VSERAAALVEFALAWPLALILVFACVQLAIWGAEEHAARSASLAGARAGAASDAGPATATAVALAALAPTLVAVKASAWCPGAAPTAAEVWVCSRAQANSVSVEISGSVPALVPLVGGGRLPISAAASVGKESFTR
jgi:hypothetical protein